MGRRAGCGVGILCTPVLSQNVNLVTLRGHTIKIIVMTWNKTCMQMSAAQKLVKTLKSTHYFLKFFQEKIL